MTSKLSRFLNPETQLKPARTARVARTARLQGFTLADLEQEAYPDEWRQAKDNEAALKTFALMLHESQQVSNGKCPDRWTGRATCSRCGSIAVAPFLDGASLSGCRWCRSRDGVDTASQTDIQ